MNRKNFLVAGMVLMLASAGIAGAQQAKRARAGGRMSLTGRLVSGLNLTPDQKAQVKSIIAKNRPQIIQTRTQLLQARIDLLSGNANGAGELGNAVVAAANLRASILGQIKPILTGDQLAQLQQKEQQRVQRLQQRLDRLNKKTG